MASSSQLEAVDYSRSLQCSSNNSPKDHHSLSQQRDSTAEIAAASSSQMSLEQTYSCHPTNGILAHDFDSTVILTHWDSLIPSIAPRNDTCLCRHWDEARVDRRKYCWSIRRVFRHSCCRIIGRDVQCWCGLRLDTNANPP
jgi:hypothetical protein